MELTARKVVLELLSAAPLEADGLPIRALVRVAGVFGLAENSVRVAVTRLAAEQRLESPERGVYRLGHAARPVHQRVLSWRTLDELLIPWDGRWVGIATSAVAKSQRKRRRSSDRALSLWGFRELVPGLSIRPANLIIGTTGLREQLAELGLDRSMPVFELSELGPDVDRAMALWDGERHSASYRTLALGLAESDARLDALPLADAVRESFLLGREVLRALVLDPLLPEPLVSASDRSELIAAMRAYDRRGRAFWTRFLLQETAVTGGRVEVR